MKLTIRFSILDHSLSIFIDNTCCFIFFSLGTMEIILINKVITCVIRWVNINHFDLTHI